LPRGERKSKKPDITLASTLHCHPPAAKRHEH